MAIDQRRMRLLEWCLEETIGEQQPRTQVELAKEIGVHSNTLTAWKKEPDFQERMREMTIEFVGSPARIQAVLDAMFNEAIDSSSGKQVQAAKVFADILGLNKKREERQKDPKKRLLEMPKDEFNLLVNEVIAEAHTTIASEGPVGPSKAFDDAEGAVTAETSF